MLEQTILSNLIFNEDYCKKVYPFIKEEYFDDNSYKKIFNTFSSYINKYNGSPSIEALKISIDNRKDLNEDSFKDVIKTIDVFKIDENTNQEWLISETEKFCQDKAVYNAIRQSILVLDGKDKNLDKGSIPKLLNDALGISFDNNIGHDFLEDYEARYDYYHRKEERLDTDLDFINKITKGGFPRKSMTILLATSGGGKSLTKCHLAAQQLLYGRNVLYITMEMAEAEIARRIDANIMNITLDEVKDIPLDVLEKRMSRFKDKTVGKLIIKEYPTGSAHSGHFRHLLNELRLKKNFKPDFVCIDYLNICASARVKDSNSYGLVKAVAEELRGLAMEFDFALLSSSQYNRGAYGSTDIDMQNVSESMGTIFTSDAIFALISTEELEQMGQLMIKQLKNRWGDISQHRRFVIGIDRAKMKLFNLEETAQSNMMNEDKPTFDKGKFSEQFDSATKKGKKKQLFEVGEIS